MIFLEKSCFWVVKPVFFIRVLCTDWPKFSHKCSKWRFEACRLSHFTVQNHCSRSFHGSPTPLLQILSLRSHILNLKKNVGLVKQKKISSTLIDGHEPLQKKQVGRLLYHHLDYLHRVRCRKMSCLTLKNQVSKFAHTRIFFLWSHDTV